jgi:hypothetical protein
VNLLAAYRRDYEWGANFGEQVSDGFCLSLSYAQLPPSAASPWHTTLTSTLVWRRRGWRRAAEWPKRDALTRHGGNQLCTRGSVHTHTANHRPPQAGSCVDPLSALVGQNHLHPSTTASLSNVCDVRMLMLTLTRRCGRACAAQWAQTSASVENKVWHGNEINLRINLLTGPTTPDCNIQSTDANVRGACLGACPTRDTHGIYDEGINRTNTGCVNTMPQYDNVQIGDSNGNGIQGENFYIRFPPVKQNNGADIVVCPE